MEPPIATTLPSTTLPSGMSMSWPNLTRSLSWSWSGGSGTSGVSGASGSSTSPASSFAASALCRAMRDFFETASFAPSMTRTEIPSSSDPARAVLSATAFERLFEGAEAPRAGCACTSNAAIIKIRSESAAIQERGLVRTIRSEREANMAHTPFVAAGWSQQYVERESQGDENGAGHLNLGRPEGNDRGARNRPQGSQREPDLVRERHVEGDLVAEPLRARRDRRCRGMDRGHDPYIGVGNAKGRGNPRQIRENHDREREGGGAQRRAETLRSRAQESAGAQDLAHDAVLEEGGRREQRHA